MNDWWNIPATYGAEYDEYDYYYTEVPENTREWSRWEYKCSECGKYHRLNVVYTAYFRTIDGWDSIATEVCWLCEIKNIIYEPFRKIKRKISKEFKAHKFALDLLDRKRTFNKNVEMYKLGLEIGRK